MYCATEKDIAFGRKVNSDGYLIAFKLPNQPFVIIFGNLGFQQQSFKDGN